jgi:hypothetical protein
MSSAHTTVPEVFRRWTITDDDPLLPDTEKAVAISPLLKVAMPPDHSSVD